MNDSARAKDTWNPDYCCRRLDDCKWGGVGPCDSRAYALVAAEQTAALRAEVERLRAELKKLGILKLPKAFDGNQSWQCWLCLQVNVHKPDCLLAAHEG